MNNFDPSLMNLTKLMPNQVGLMYVDRFFYFQNRNFYTKYNNS